MRAYKVSGMTCSGCERSVTQALKERFGDEIAVEASAQRGEVRVSEAADPQIVVFTIDTAGYTVDEVKDA
ncbi:heavy-metal-associated domain-containing protein [Devosia sp. RR2S18]|uniref:heavy-metal-associated domain-containing protein n=1 Tax=Devosia rhizosphaerae TaxID=3049774 RepID=UPI00253FCCCF|nr:cation transporter [Devosia sp. RR2S18]WIJ26454.1 cation transporter [Devosia sp. RR2S18]